MTEPKVGPAPLGYKPIKDRMGRITGYEFDARTGAVQLMTNLFLEGRPYAEITRLMNDSEHKPLRGKKWWDSTIRKVLASNIYAGEDRFPPLWSADTFQAVMWERARRESRPYIRHDSSVLAGVAICGECHGPMTVYERSERGILLRCATHAQEGLCHPNHIYEHILWLQTMEDLHQWVKDDLDQLLQSECSFRYPYWEAPPPGKLSKEEEGAWRKHVSQMFMGHLPDYLPVLGIWLTCRCLHALGIRILCENGQYTRMEIAI